MRTKNFFVGLLSVFASVIFAQDRTTVTATSNDISENLDLRAVASIFGESRDLEDFERRLNDPRTQISNLDLNQDYQVDYLRVIETVDGPTHLIVIQSVLGRDLFQDVATIEVERDRNNVVQVQVVGDVYMYGPNYIYEPVYVSRPVIFDVFWAVSYRPYYSPWYWGYYPTYYSYWAPCPVYRYRNNIHVHINVNNTYNYVSTRRSSRAVAMYNTRRSNAYERQHPNRSFTSRTNATNRYALEQTRESSRIQRSASTSARTSYSTPSRVSQDSNYNRGRSLNSARTDNNGNVRVTTPSRGSAITSPSTRGNDNTRTTTAPSRTNGNSNTVRST